MALAELLSNLDDGQLDERIRTLEVHRRRVIAEQALAIAVAEARCLYLADGHHSMTSYLRATLNCSSSEYHKGVGWRSCSTRFPVCPTP